MVFLGVAILVNLITVWLFWEMITLIHKAQAGEPFLPEWLTQMDDSIQNMAPFQIIVWLIWWIPFLLWVYRVHSNLSALGARHLKYSPGWAVGGFLIPFVNLVLPIPVMREIWKASDPFTHSDDHSWQKADTPSWVVVWWPLFIILWAGAVIVNLYVDRLFGEETSDPLNVALIAIWSGLIIDALRIVWAGMTMRLIWAVYTRQEKRHTYLPQPVTQEYAGFWRRTVALLIDLIVLVIPLYEPTFIAIAESFEVD